MEDEATPDLWLNDEERDRVDLYAWLFQVPSPSSQIDNMSIETIWKEEKICDSLTKMMPRLKIKFILTVCA